MNAIEKVAKEIYESGPIENQPPWEKLALSKQRDSKVLAEAAIRALTPKGPIHPITVQGLILLGLNLLDLASLEEFHKQAFYGTGNFASYKCDNCGRTLFGSPDGCALCDETICGTCLPSHVCKEKAPTDTDAPADVPSVPAVPEVSLDKLKLSAEMIGGIYAVWCDSEELHLGEVTSIDNDAVTLKNSFSCGELRNDGPKLEDVLQEGISSLTNMEMTPLIVLTDPCLVRRCPDHLQKIILERVIENRE